MHVEDADDVLVDVAPDLEETVGAVRPEAVGTQAALAVDAVRVDLALPHLLVLLARPEELATQ